jgi:hypothetical protein
MFSGQYLLFFYLFLAANWACVLVVRRRAKSTHGAQRTIEDDE